MLSMPAAAPTLRDRLARTLRKHRVRRRWTIADAAAAFGMRAETYQQIEEGNVNATLQTLERLCERLKVDVRALFEL